MMPMMNGGQSPSGGLTMTPTKNNNKSSSSSTFLMVASCFICFFLGRMSQDANMPTEILKSQKLMAMITDLQDQVIWMRQKLEEVELDGGHSGGHGGSTPQQRVLLEPTTSSSSSSSSSNVNVNNFPVNNYKQPIGEIPESRMKDMTTLTTVTMDGMEVCHHTESRGWEVVFDSFIGTIFREPGFLPPEGGILDVGAQFAEQSCHYGSTNPHRKVFTIDPSPSNQQFANETYGVFMPNMRLGNHGMGAEMGEMKTTGDFFNMPKHGMTIPIKTIDSIFVDAGEKMAFAHIDVEGMELEVLKGGRRTILADKPVFTTELRVHRNHNYSTALLTYIDELGYDSYVINEVCGFPFMDFRNILNIPRRELSAKLVHSDVFSLALASETIFRVTPTTIFDLVLPCCRPYGPCCKHGDKTNRPKFGCCSEKNVLAFLKDNPPTDYPLPAAFKDWNGAKRVTENRWKMLQERSKAEAGQY